MKSRTYFIALILIGSFLFSCDKSDLEYEDEVENSRKAWLDFKDVSENSYRYVVRGGSVLIDYGWETTVTVSKSIIIEGTLNIRAIRSCRLRFRKKSWNGPKMRLK